jgi:hypothetical protein
MSDILDDGTRYSVSDMLEEAMERVKELKIKKAIVILLDETAKPDNQIKWHQAGLCRTEHLRLLSMAKDDYLLEFALGHTHE